MPEATDDAVPASTTSADAPVRVLFVAGTGRSGSTLVSMVLGHLPGVFSAGELRFLWTRGVQEDQLCGCGSTFSACPVWIEVMARLASTLPTGESLDASGVALRLRRRIRARRVPLVLLRLLAGRPAITASPQDDAVLVALYRAVQRASGARVVVDSSKLPLYGLLLQSLPDLDVTVLHLVRDPRAASFSWLRTRATRQRDDDPPMNRVPVLKSSALWLLWNLVALLAWKSGPRRPAHLRLTYEGVVRDPATGLAEVVRAVGGQPDQLPLVDRSTLRLGVTHTVAGNPSRRDTGTVGVADDDEWRRGLRRRQRLLITALTAPARVPLGYPARAGTVRTTTTSGATRGRSRSG